MTEDKNSEPHTHTQKSPYINAEKDFTPNEHEDYGYFFYPERFGKKYEIPWYMKAFTFSGSRDILRKAQCEQNVRNSLEYHPGVKLLSNALKKAGCEVNLMRHFSCEHCDSAVDGGFDPTTNQSIICHNQVSSKSAVATSMIRSMLHAFDYCRANYDAHNLRHLACTEVILCYNRVYKYDDCAKILSHELIHAFDHCRANIDFLNKYHIACTEIRAANLTPCTISDAMDYDVSIFKLKDGHKECVRRRAVLSLQMVRNLKAEEALKIIDEVFDKCYNDKEPFGRTILNDADYEKAYRDRFKYNY